MGLRQGILMMNRHFLKRKRRSFLFFCFGLVLLVSIFALVSLPRRQVLRLGIYSNSSWDVPSAKDNEAITRAIKRFEKKYPNVTVTYETGILKSDYSNWLSDEMINGSQPDIFMVPENDFNLFASTSALRHLDDFLSRDVDQSNFYPAAFAKGSYQGVQYALPFESNPLMMCVNKDLLEKEGISLPTGKWTVQDLYQISQQLTKDTDGDGVIDQFGLAGYTWQDIFAAFGIDLFNSSGTKAYVDTEATREALSMLVKLNDLNGHYKVTSQDFDQGKVAFYPMTLAQYRTYNPYPYHVSKYSQFSWTCIAMPADIGHKQATPMTTSLFAISSKTQLPDMAWAFLKLLTTDEAIQQTVFETSQGSSVLKSVMMSQETKQTLTMDAFGGNSLSQKILDEISQNAYVEPNFRKYNKATEQLDYLLGKSLEEGTVDNDLPTIQVKIDDILK